MPMTFIWLSTFKYSCEEIDKLFEGIRWECIGSRGIYNADIDVVSIGKDKSSNNEKQIIQVIKEIMEKFEKLTKGWSLMLFVSLTSESIIVTNSGFLISKYTILKDENTDVNCITFTICLSNSWFFLCNLCGLYKS